MQNDFDTPHSDSDKSERIIILNGREQVVTEHKLSFENIVFLALNEYDSSENISYTVTYSKGNHPDKGALVPGDSVTVKKGMIINVSKTTRS